MFLTAMQTKDSFTKNGAISNSTSGSGVLDYFAKCGSYSQRDQLLVDADMASIFGENQELALKVLFYNRLVTRKCVLGKKSTEKVQRGQGRKDEFVKGLKWLENNHPDLLYKNLWLVPTVGCWKDLWYDSTSGFHHYVNRDEVYSLIKRSLRNKTHRQLIAKYLPKIRSSRNCSTERHRRLNHWARGLCKYLGWTEKQYRQFKSRPDNTAHLWQRFACDNKWDLIDFNTIPGKALFNITTRKGKDGKCAIERHNLSNKYIKWIESKPVVNFNGYPYELYLAATSGRNLIQTYTLNKQFDKLLQTAKDGVNPDLLKKGVFCALDTSGSMSSTVQGKIKAIDVCVGLGIFFSSLIEGAFKDNVIMFDDHSRVKKLSGNFCEKVDQIRKEHVAWGGTNFQSVIDEIVRVRHQNPNIPVEEYPKCILVVSDMQFNPTGTIETNYEMLMRKLAQVGLPKMTLIWWQVNGQYAKDVPCKMSDDGTVLISGFDGSIVTNILGGEKKNEKGETVQLNPYEQMLNALDQEVLNLVVV